LPLKYLAKIYQQFNISCEIAFVDDTGNQHTAKRYGISNTVNTIKLILIFDHFMPNVIVDKSLVTHLKINRNIKLSSLIAHLMRKNLFLALSMKYCHIDVNAEPLKTLNYYCKLIKDNKT
jgi:hypothetical protein